MIPIHLTAHLRSGKLDLRVGGRAAKLWRYLRAAFPFALAVILMPTHLHVVAFVLDVLGAWVRLHRAIGAHARGLGRTVWSPVPPPKAIATRGKLARDIRYVNLNPTRKRLVSDPLEWMYSTHRDAVDAVVDPWVTPKRLHDALGGSRLDFIERHHRYVSSDPSVRVDGTPLPLPEPPHHIPTHSLWDVALAACAAHRSPTSAIRRPGPIRETFLALAIHQGWLGYASLIASTGASRSTVKRAIGRRSPPPHAAVLCLGDRRLLVGIEPASSRPDCPLLDPKEGPWRATDTFFGH